MPCSSVPRPRATPDVLACLQRARAAGVHLVCVDGQPGGGLEVCSVTADNFGGQAVLADFVFRKLKGRGNIAYLQGDLASDSGVLRDHGAAEYLAALSKNPSGACRGSLLGNAGIELRSRSRDRPTAGARASGS